MALAERAVARYLATVVEQPAFARLFLVEVAAAGPEALARRAALQDRLARRLGTLLGAGTAGQRFAVRSYVAAVSALVATPLAAGDLEGVRALRRPLVQHLRSLVDAELLGTARRPRGAAPAVSPRRPSTGPAARSAGRAAASR